MAIEVNLVAVGVVSPSGLSGLKIRLPRFVATCRDLELPPGAVFRLGEVKLPLATIRQGAGAFEAVVEQTTTADQRGESGL